MWNLHEYGGIKLINLKVKSQTSKVKWLVDIATNENLMLNLHIFSYLIGTQIGEIRGRDIIFLQKSYFQHQLMSDSKFYTEALVSLSELQIKKGMEDIHAWDRQHIFYNPLFLTQQGKTITLTGYCKKNNVYTYDQLLKEKEKEHNKQKHDKALLRLLRKIEYNTTRGCFNTSKRRRGTVNTDNSETIVRRDYNKNV